ncbi:hypothetical protein [Haladaptatus sp. DYF46]|uniref:hypothetical protein n=1 Tax=Haladaptatus sp. DYF46 TaxID=2886041 RepID=UPI001E43C45A|nr:hypothetical protein [Haladaptatus sp. DYF46]
MAITGALCRFSVVFVRLILRREGVGRPVVGCVFDGGHVFADSVAVDVVRARTGHQFAGHVVDGDGVLVVFRVLVALVGAFNESGGIDVERELFGLCAFLCRLDTSKTADVVKYNKGSSGDPNWQIITDRKFTWLQT